MANTTNYNWETPDDTDLVKDGAAAIRTLGSSVDTTTKALNPSTTLGDIEYRSSTANTNTRLGIGSTGQVLTVAGGVPTWATSDDANAIQNAIVDAKGDIVAASAADTPARLAVGTDNQRLVAASGEATGLKYVSDTQNTVIDAAGDLVYGTAADTLGKLAIGTAGQVLTVNSGATAPEWATPSAGSSGLNLITTETFSGVSDYTKDSLFSSTYDNYRIVIEFVGSQNAAFQYQLRSGGSNITSANYARQIAFFANTTGTFARDTGDTNNSLGNTYNTGRNLITMDLASPFLSQHKTHISNAFNTTNTANLNLSNGTVLVTTSCTGIRFFPNNGTITGTVSYYGYGK